MVQLGSHLSWRLPNLQLDRNGIGKERAFVTLGLS